ncbi:MAG: insulinase family protein, partial [Rhizobiaceae bacterium]
DAAEWTVTKAEYADWFAGREADLPDIALRAGRDVLFPGGNGIAGPNWTAQSIARITLDDAKAAFAALFQPAAVTIYSVGPLPLDTVRASLEKTFGGWEGKGPGLGAKPHPAAGFPAGRTVLLLPEPGASQSALFVARPAPGVTEPGRGEAVAVANLLGGDFNSRLNSVIREEKGYSYGVDAYLFDDIAAGSALAVATTVERDNTGPAVAEILRGFDSLSAKPVGDDEVNRTVTAYRQALAGVSETASGLFAALLTAVGSGTTLEENQKRREERTRLTRDAVADEALKLAPLAPSLIVVAGDPRIVLPQLTAIGLTDVRRVERAQPVVRDRDAPLADDEATDFPPWIGAGEGRGSTRTIHPGSRTP